MQTGSRHRAGRADLQRGIYTPPDHIPYCCRRRRFNLHARTRIWLGALLQIEECDVQLLLLGKLCKGSLDLPKWVTSRVDRDFRIDQKVVAVCQEEVRATRQKRKRGATGKNKKDTSKSSAKKKKSARPSASNKASVGGLFS